MEIDRIKALEIVQECFKNKTDKGGAPYVNRLYRVENIIDSEHFPSTLRERITALLHDLLEDCPEWTEERLRNEFPTYIVDAVVLLTRKKGQNYMEYLEKLKGNYLARIVKLADLEDNMNLTRLNYELTDRDIERIKKYHKAYLYLKGL